MKDARLRVQRDETGFSRQVEPDAAAVDDDKDGSGDDDDVSVVLVGHYRRDTDRC